jgi:hypothetical protein
MATIKEGGSFETFNDVKGNPLISLNRDGTISNQGLTFADGTKQVTAGGSSAQPTTINGFIGVLIKDAAGNDLMFLAPQGTAGPQYVYIWLGANAVNPTSSNYSIVADTIDQGSSFADLFLNCTGGNVNFQNNGVTFLSGGARIDGGNGVQTIGPLYVGTIPPGSPLVSALILTGPMSPTSAATGGVLGQIAWDASNFYVCTAGGVPGSATWKKTALTTV